eukprot:m.66113 g.66113  ORF g.66113 m.66113 type:complete len:60 (+) comp12101_c0_seq3:131-310(+)
MTWSYLTHFESCAVLVIPCQVLFSHVTIILQHAPLVLTLFYAHPFRLFVVDFVLILLLF